MNDRPDEPDDALSRRSLLTRAGAAAAAIGVGGITTGCASDAGSGAGPVGLTAGTDTSSTRFMPGMTMPMTGGVHGFFTKEEARAVDAFASPILPGSPEDSTAHGLGVVTFIDHTLASFKTFAAPGANPTGTIGAITYRAADAIRDRYFKHPDELI
jgi:hypothetical protein